MTKASATESGGDADMRRDHITEIVVFTVLFLLVSGMGFVAARWRAPKDMAHLDEWGLGGRSFGGWITWFLVGGDLYTAYTFVAVPALIFGAGAAGFFAVPYTVVIYPMFFLILIRLWSVSHRHGFVTPADFVRTRFELADARAADRDHRHRGDDAVHRAAAGRHRGGAQDDGRDRRQRCSPGMRRSSSRSRSWRRTPTSPGCGRPR